MYRIDGCLLLSVEFIEGVSQFSVKGDKESKLKCKYTLVQKTEIYISIYKDFVITMFNVPLKPTMAIVII